MNLSILYHWQEMVSKHFSSFTVWQRKRLALFSLGVMLCEHCHQSRIAKVLAVEVMADCIVRQLRRCLADQKWTAAQFSLDWTRWVVSFLPKKRLVLLVDETSIGGRFRVMMVGLAYKRRCIQLAWTCYKARSQVDYPIEGQVRMIADMLAQLKTVLPADRPVMVLADRGIGNSPALCKAVEALGWHYLFRVPKTVKIKTDSGILHPYKQVQQGGRWRASGSVFIKRGKLPAHVRAIWERDCAEPWILVTNNPDLTGREYAMRNWQEQSFRDLKSGGWQLEMCRLRSVERMERFLAILALAQGMALALGSQAVITGKARRLIKTKDDKLRRPLSLFKEGIAYFNKYIIRHDKFPSLPIVPEQTPC